MLIFNYELITFSIIWIILVQSKDIQQKLNNQNEDVFKQMFKVRRLEQLEAVKKMRKLTEDKQRKMLDTIIKTICDVISKSKTILENSGYVPGTSIFPENESIRDALSLVLENTALLGEIVLRLPEVSESVLRSTPEWSTLLRWSLNFVNQTGLVDKSTTSLINLASQELNLTTRSSDFINPYRGIGARSKANLQQEKEVPKKKKKKSEIPRGPRLTLRHTGEL